MDSEFQQAQGFYADFQMLDFALNRRQKKTDQLRNFFLLLLAQLFLVSFCFFH